MLVQPQPLLILPGVFRPILRCVTTALLPMERACYPYCNWVLSMERPFEFLRKELMLPLRWMLCSLLLLLDWAMSRKNSFPPLPALTCKVGLHRLPEGS